MTVVEWLFEQLTEVDYKCINKTFLQNNNSLAGCKLRELFEQAKEMEKQHIIYAFRNGYLCHSKTGEQYYNEKFKMK